MPCSTFTARAAVPALLAALAAAPAVAQEGPRDPGPRIQMDLPGGTVSIDCGRTSISDCASAIRPLVELATQAARDAPGSGPSTVRTTTGSQRSGEGGGN